MRTVVLVLVGLAITGCQSIAPTDVTFSEGGTSEHVDKDGDDASVLSDGAPAPADAGIDRGTPPTGGALDGVCTCTATPGFGCCVRPANATVTCTSIDDCATPNALWIGCQNRNAGTNDNCCWNGSTQRAASLPGASCNGRAEACTKDTDCLASSGPCKTRSCNGVTIGACTTTGEAPACPP
jgi:hypothetical protein